MRALMIAAAVAALTCSISAPSYAQTSQQALMKSCNSDAAAKKLKGDARKGFMSDCLAGRASPASSAMAQTPQATQQQRMKDCNTNAASQKLKGTARKDYMSSCLSGGTAASAPAAMPSSTTASTPAAQTTAQTPQATQQQRMKDCNTNAASQKLKGTARKDFMSSCLSGGTAASAPSTAIPAAPAATAAKPEAPAATRTIAAPGAPMQPAQPSTSGSAPATTALGVGQYATEAQAKSTCGTDTVVWVNTDSHIYHFKSAADYGKTKQGAYMCEREAVTGGSRAAKNEKRS